MALDVQPISPDALSVPLLRWIYPVIHDMWAESSWELFQCEACHRHIGKTDMFWHLPKIEYIQSATSLLRNQNQDTLFCPSCASSSLRMLHTYGEEIIGIRDRVLRSIASMCYVWQEQDAVVWYGEVYVNDIESGFNREIAPHYSRLGIDRFRDRIFDLLGYIPDTVMVFSFLTLLAQFRWPRAFAQFLQSFANTEIFHTYHESMGLMEVARGGPVYRLIRWMWGIDLTWPWDIWQQFYEWSSTYESSILILPNCISTFRSRFTRERTRWILAGV